MRPSLILDNILNDTKIKPQKDLEDSYEGQKITQAT